MDINSFITPTIVSTAISTLLVSLVNSLVIHKQNLKIETTKKEHQIEIEKMRQQLIILSDTAHEATERRFSAYPKIAELIYRTRNLSREIVSTRKTDSELINLLCNKSEELEDRLYEYRIDLENDQIFGVIHNYKNIVKNFIIILINTKHECEINQNEYFSGEMLQKLKSEYENINIVYESAITQLSSKNFSL